MTVRNPLVIIPGSIPLIQELPAGDSIGGAPSGPPGINWLGAWSSSTTYNADDAVSYNGSSYICILSNTNQTPTNTTYWSVLASKGDTGATGAAGTNGTNGTNGANGTGSGANFIANGRLTLTTATPVTTSDVTGATTIYYTPYVGNQISTYDSSVWSGHTFSEVSLALGTLTSGANYDVFIYNNAGTLTLEFSAAWTSDTARTDALALQDGVYVKSADHSRRYLGTFRTTATTTTEDSAAKRYLFNQNNRVPRHMANATESTNSWTYSTATWRQARATATNQLDYVTGDAATYAEALTMGVGSSSTVQDCAVGVGVNSTSANSAYDYGMTLNSSFATQTKAMYRGYPGLGRNFLAWLEIGAGSGTQTWYGNKGTTRIQSGITGVVLL